MKKQWRTVRVLVEIPVRNSVSDARIVSVVREFLEQSHLRDELALRFVYDAGKPRVKSLKRMLQRIADCDWAKVLT